MEEHLLQTKRPSRATCVSLRIVSVLGILLATTAPAGLAGPADEAERLPYVDNLATLVVCQDAGAVRQGELMRVLRPYGAAALNVTIWWMNA